MVSINFLNSKPVMHGRKRGIRMQLKEQVHVLTLARHKNITKAAEELGMSQPALSTFLSNLEKGLGIRLFERNEKPMKLTEAGEIYVRKAVQMLELKAEFDLELTHLVNSHPARIRVGIQQIRAPHIVTPLTMAMKQEFPNVEVIFYENSGTILYDMLRTGKLDMILCNKREIWPDMEYVWLMNERLLFAVPPNHPALTNQRKTNGKYPWIDLNLFRQDTFILSPSGFSTRYFADQLFKMQGWTPKKQEIYPRTETTVHMAAAGMGVAFVLESYLSYFNLVRQPKYFIVGEPAVMTEYVAVYPKNKYNSPVFNHFIDMIRFILSQ